MSVRISPPRPRVLSAGEAEAVLRRNHVGRLAFSHRDRVDVQPIHYVAHDGWIYGRTSPGSKLEQIARNRWVALEVDEVEDLFRWRSVVVRGAFYVLSPDGPPWERAAWATGVERLRLLIPETLTADDPAPHRTVVFRVAVQEVSGRAAEIPAQAGPG